MPLSNSPGTPRDRPAPRPARRATLSPSSSALPESAGTPAREEGQDLAKGRALFTAFFGSDFPETPPAPREEGGGASAASETHGEREAPLDNAGEGDDFLPNKPVRPALPDLAELRGEGDRPRARRKVADLTSAPPAREAQPEPTPEQIRATAAQRKKKKIVRVACNIAIGLFSAVFVVCAVKFGVDVYQNHRGQSILADQRDKFRPQDSGEVTEPLRATSSGAAEDDYTLGGGRSNASIVELQAAYPDVCGWISIDGTNIDNLYVQGENYDEYLRRDLNGEYVTAGTLFLEPLCTRDFSSFNTILFGHNMKNGTMFGDIKHFAEQDYWSSHETGKIYLSDRTYGLQIFALLVVHSNDSTIYNPYIKSRAERQAFLDYARENARRYRDVGVCPDDTILTMSTCSYEFEDARFILLARLMRVQ